MTIWRVRIACWISKATDTHSEYVILIGFPRQKFLRGCASMFLYMYNAILGEFSVSLSRVYRHLLFYS